MIRCHIKTHGLKVLHAEWAGLGCVICPNGGFLKILLKIWIPRLRHLSLGVRPWRNVSHLERLGFIEPILGPGDHILQLQTVGQIRRDVVDFLERRLQRFHAVIGPEIAERSMNSTSLSEIRRYKCFLFQAGWGLKKIVRIYVIWKKILKNERNAM